ncbi:MAG: ferrochelatase [Candidatus Eisenbacteria bacterium]|uniref:Ferrochelatase n=1 Tax=Eiseniibacteriota bacterium TaxID=2212470 RepID=A0A956NAK6_UNCEI|nr:ferrochelatase [Candidatus Eisenbacteria bacterium]MCB9462704.1 ferrochelatase [Candidatus Eisenbacteria bacterium]
MTSPSQIGVLLCNLGTPDAPTAAALRPYLREFLGDPRVVELRRWQWLPVLYGFILPFRPKKSAKLYETVWTDQGSPLLVLSQKLTDGVARALGTEAGIRVGLGMRYGNPSIGSALEALKAEGCSRILVVPLYPQYSATTAGSTFDAVWQELLTWRVVPEIRTVREYGTEDGYLDALVASIRERWNSEGEPERLLLSFHGIPKRYYDHGDPYPDQCRETARLLREKLGMTEERCLTSFQSVFGREEWVKPATDATVEQLARNGVKTLDVICPGFSVDCLETLEEIDGQNREIFLEHGGERFRYIPCLNDREDHVRMLTELIARSLQGWVLPESAAMRSLGGS